MSTPPSPAAAPTAGRHGMAGRAISAAHRYRGADPAGFDARHHDWPRWTRRASIARVIATALGVPVEHVTVTDDPDRR